MEHDKGALEGLIKQARAVAQPSVDLSGLLGLKSPLLVEVDDLHTVVSGHPDPKLVLRWDGDKTLEVRKTDGGVMATLRVTF